MSEVEKLNREFEKSQTANQKALEDYKILQSQHEATVKNYNLEKIGSTIKFMDTIPQDLRRIAIEKSFGEVDISDDAAVTLAKETFTTQYKSILASEDTAKGSGSSVGDSTINSTKTPDKMTVDERAKYLSDHKLN